ncbi:Hypothetical predicted protein, partial [Pelobates cultripes]
MSGTNLGMKQLRKKLGHRQESHPSMLELLAAPRPLQASQDGRLDSPRGSLFPVSMADIHMGEATQILQKLTEVKTYLPSEISRHSREVKAEIQALGTRTSQLEHKVESVVQVQNTAISHAELMAQQIDQLKMQVKDLSNHS